MLTPDVRIEGFDAADWILLGQILGRDSARLSRGPGSEAEESPDAPSGGVIVLLDGGHVVKVLSTVRGRLDPSRASVVGPLEDVAVAEGAAWALRVNRAALAELSDRFARRLVREDRFLGQSLKLLAVVRELADEGALETHPRDVRLLPVPSEKIVARSLDVVCPVGRTILLGAFEGGEVLTSVALHRGRGGFDRIVGPSEVRRDLGLVSADWTRNVPGLARAVELSVGPLALGCFAQMKTWKRLASDGAPGAWAAAALGRELLLHPVAPALAIPLGVDVGRAAVAVARDLAARFGDVLSGASPLRQELNRFRDAGQGELSRLLGFDPFALLRELLGHGKPGA
jgi:hypothetical protein